MKKQFKNTKKNSCKKYLSGTFFLRRFFFKKNSKGIAIVGVLTASAIGLIVLAGTTQMFLQLTSRIGLQEDLVKRKFFENWLAGTLQDPTACRNTLKEAPDPFTDYDVPEIKNTAGTTLLNFYNTAGKERLKNEFGINNFDRLRFTEYDSSKREAKLVLYTKSFLHGKIPIYNKDLVLNLTGVTLSGGKIATCSVDSASLDAIFACMRVYDDKSLIGCGTTTKLRLRAPVVSYGYNAGGGSLTPEGDRNTFIGLGTSTYSTKGQANTIVGHYAGRKNRNASFSVMIGFETGQKIIGRGIIDLNNNLIVGSNSNIFLGARAGKNNTLGGGNIFIGNKAGQENTEGDYNIFIGDKAAELPDYQTESDKFVVGNRNAKAWIIGGIGTDDLRVNGKKVCLEDGTNCISSSRVYKKNIKSFQDFKESLQNILNTPLFTYQYKKNHPEKSRMGLISEELPVKLQIQIEGAPSRPDWPSIYGTLWAGVKALAKLLAVFKEEILKQVGHQRAFISESLISLKADTFLKLKARQEKAAFIFNSLIKTKQRLTREQENLEKTEEALLKVKRRLKKRKEVLGEVEKRLSEARAKLLKNQMEDKKKWESYDKKIKNLEKNRLTSNEPRYKIRRPRLYRKNLLF